MLPTLKKKEDTDEEKQEKIRLQYNAQTNTVLCEVCGTRVGLGRGKTENYHKTHKGTPTCLALKAKAEREQKRQAASFPKPPVKKDQSLLLFMKAIPGKLASRTPPSSSKTPLLGPIEISDDDKVDTRPNRNQSNANTSSSKPNNTPSDIGLDAASHREPSLVQHAQHPIALVNDLQSLIARLPNTIPEATEDDVLAQYSGDPAVHFDYPDVYGEAVWEAGLNRALKDGLGWGDGKTDWDVVIRRGERGVGGLLRLVEYFVTERGVPESLFKGKLTLITEEMEKRAMTGPAFEEQTAHPILNTEPVALMEHNVEVLPPQPPTNTIPRLVQCRGYLLPIPEGQSPHTSYPFGLHGAIHVPWNYMVEGEQMFLISHTCQRCLRKDERHCGSCGVLAKNGVVQGILDRMSGGAHKSTTYAYLGWNDLVGSLKAKSNQNSFLRFNALNQTRAILRQKESLSNHKRLVVAIANEDVPRVARVVYIALKKKRGVAAVLEQVMEAARGVYDVKSFSEKERLLAVLLWRLGGDRIGHIGYRALGLPSVSTLRDGSVKIRVLPSVGKPTAELVAQNLRAVLAGVMEILKENCAVIKHVVVMLDELATERRVRYCCRNNKIYGLCRAHGGRVSQDFASMDDVQEMFEAVDKGEVCIASQATIGALGILCAESRVYAARTILISSDCMKESGPEHRSNVLEPVIQGVNMTAQDTGLRLVSVASDGESRRGTALILQTFKRPLSKDSSIFPLLSPLSLLNLHVGDDDLTCDKDWKHVFKRLRNLLLRDRGVLIDDFRITPAVTKSHLEASGSSKVHVNSVFNPNDLQDVRLAFQLLHDIWTLPPLSSDNPTNPGSTRAREALRVLGKLLHHLVYAYVCVDLSLSEQLEHLSAAAHLLFVLYKTAGKEFIPTLLYIDIILMIKNVFFCIAKAKVDTPDACFFIILLGTDRLEIKFGILRTVVGNDANLDVLQISERTGGLLNIADILAQRPEWDRGPQRLAVPTISRLNEQDVPTSADHLSPKYLKGNYSLRSVTVLTCWRRGRAIAESEYAPAAAVLKAADEDGSVDMLSPNGTLLVDADLSQDDIDESSEALLLNTQTVAETQLGDDDVTQVDLEDELQTMSGGVDSSVFPTNPAHFESTVTFNGKVMPKAKALALYSRYYKKVSSTDRLKRVQEIERYSTLQAQKILNFESDEQILLVHDPIATLVRAQDDLWLAIGEVNGIRYDGQAIDQLGHNLLSEPAVKISFQLVGLRSVVLDDEEVRTHDWKSYGMPGRSYEALGKHIEPINPDLSTPASGRPFYLSKTAFLVATSGVLVQRLGALDLRNVPKSGVTIEYPYREPTGKACFLAKLASNETETDGGDVAWTCSLCSPPIELDMHRPQRVLEHIGAHILFDSSVSRVEQPCGMCLRPSMQCQYFLLKGKGAKGKPQVDMERSAGCPRLVNFQWGKAAISEKNAPCSNVPLFCPLCPKAVWRYNLHQHLTTSHSPDMAVQYADIYDIRDDETDAMRHIWTNRLKQPKKRRKRTGAPALVVSEAHTNIDNLPRVDGGDGTSDADEGDGPSGGESDAGHEDTDCEASVEGAGKNQHDDESPNLDLSRGAPGDSLLDNTNLQGLDDDVTMWGYENATYSPDHLSATAPSSLTSNVPSSSVPQEPPNEGRTDSRDEDSGKEEETAAPHSTHQATIDDGTGDVIAAAPPVGTSISIGRESTELGRGKRATKRKNRGHLNVCECGELVDLNDESRPIVKCAQAGCETQHKLYESPEERPLLEMQAVRAYSLEGEER